MTVAARRRACRLTPSLGHSHYHYYTLGVSEKIVSPMCCRSAISLDTFITRMPWEHER
jgi:hypothetical protein